MPIYVGGKGKKRAVEMDEGTGGASGIVLSLEEVVTGGYEVAYTLPVKVGSTNQQFSLQVDTGSSDLWIASTSCHTSSCSQAKGHLYDPKAATSTGVNFSILYLSGSAAGPIVWDSVSIGGYTVDHQALAAVTDVDLEPLSPNFSGILGLALPRNSIIAIDIPPVTNSHLVGAVWASNLFSITPANTAPSSDFLSLALSRPGSDKVPAVLGIGRHPAALIPDPSLIQYSTPIRDEPGALFWKVAVRGITVYINGTANPVRLGNSNTGAAFPSAILDSGIPLIYTTTTIANAIYGSIGINPARDGMYYVPCTTPLNITFTLDDRSETPLHPLDLTVEPAQENQAQFCTGLIQTADAQLSNPTSSKADIILGVPFMRNVYTVMAYSTPSSNGSFTPPDNSMNGGLSQTISPRLGLLSLTDPTRALQEFHNVRVLNQPIGGESTTNGHDGHSSPTVNVGGKKVSVGIVVVIGLSSFFAFCGVLFVIRWFLFWRKHWKAAAARGVHQDDDDKVAYMLTRTSPSKREKRTVDFGNDGGLSEDELRKMRFEAYMQREGRVVPDSTMSSDQTRVGDYEGAGYGKVLSLHHEDTDDGREFGLRHPTRRRPVDHEEDLEWDPATGLDWGDTTLIAQHPPRAYEIPSQTDRAQQQLEQRQELITNSHHRQNSSMALQPLLTSQSRRGNNFDIDESYDGYTRYPTLPNNKERRIS